AGSRVTDVQVKDGEGFIPLDPEKTYGVVTNNYVRGGGDGYEIFATNAVNPYDFGSNLEQAVADYLTANNPYTPYADGRITDVTPAAETAQAAEAPATETPASATSNSYTVVRGDSLWKIAEATYGNGGMWTSISDANSLRNPNL